MRRLLAVLFWSVLAAAFIGPGTVTTAAAAGAGFGFALMWTLVFSTLACWALQEAAARLTVVSGRNLGQALRARYVSGWRAAAVVALVGGAVLVGCAAYEAGNILGGVSGARLVFGWPPQMLTLASVLMAALLLWFNSPRRVALALSAAVAVMGLAFLLSAVLLRPSIGGLLRGALLPSLPDGTGLLAVGLVGTTVVPYNLFLGSGIASGQDLRELRFGIAVAVLLGGAISMGVLVTGTALSGDFRYDALAEVLAGRLGGWARDLFAVGLFAAGLSSAVTAPLAAAVTARSLFASEGQEALWSARSWRYRGVWMTILTSGLVFGLSGVRPVPAIVLAQAFNGVLLPIAAVFLLLAVNDRRIVGKAGLNGVVSNLILVVVTLTALVLGVAGVTRAGSSALGIAQPSGGAVLTIAVILAAFLCWPISRLLRRGRAGSWS